LANFSTNFKKLWKKRQMFLEKILARERERKRGVGGKKGN
jgi:hypothetical protein